MGKWNVTYDSRKYNKDWEKEHNWLMLKDGACFCKLCKCTITKFKKHNLITHEKTEKHRKNEKVLHYAKPVTNFMKPTYKDELKIFDIKFSVSVACHCSVRAVDHFTDIIKSHGKGSDLVNVRLHRTKCSCIIKNIVGVSLKQQLIEDLKDTKYSILIDETTDITSQKLLCICIRYFSKKYNLIQTEFLGVVTVPTTTGAILFEALEKHLEEFNLDLKNCIGFSSDGANNVCGAYNSVLSRIKNKNPNLFFIKCSCHSLDLCCEYAMKKLPSHIEYMIAEIARWFRSSSLRQEDFKKIFELLNESCIQPSKFISPCNTRWLVRSKCVYAILLQWVELRTYFNVIADKDRNYHARVINEMLADKRNFLYFTFILPILEEFEAMNALFQATNADLIKLYNDLNAFVQSLEFRIQNKNLGAKFEIEFQKAELNDTEKNVLYERCLEFLKESCIQAKNRLDDNFNIISNLNILHPKECLSQVRRQVKDFPPIFLSIMHQNIEIIEKQYNQILFIDWQKEFVSGEIPTDPDKFWANVVNYQNALGIKCFKELAEFALALFSLPISNAFVERVFSFVSNLKSKQRNKINVSFLDAILRIKCHLASDEHCCKNFKVTDDMLKLFTHNMYENTSANANVQHNIHKVNIPGPSSGFTNIEEEENFDDITEIQF